MKICFLAPANNYHTQKWCKWFFDHGYEVHVISLAQGTIDNATVYHLDSSVTTNASDFKKLLYMFVVKRIRNLVQDINPDIISVHYASSYGFLAAIAGIKNYYLSLWGSDIYVFPRKSFLHKLLIRFSLFRAPYILSTSKCMALEALKYTNKTIAVTPFGVDMSLFNPNKRNKEKSPFIVGTVKTLDSNYRIDTILRAAAICIKRYGLPLRLMIGGDGPQNEELHTLSELLGISNCVEWLGYISQEIAAEVWANMDIAIIPSIVESFGVSAIEAQASGLPVIVSNASGLLETTIPGKTSILINNLNAENLAREIKFLFDNPAIRKQMGVDARAFVEEKFEYDSCFNSINDYFISNLKGS